MPGLRYAVLALALTLPACVDGRGIGEASPPAFATAPGAADAAPTSSSPMRVAGGELAPSEGHADDELPSLPPPDAEAPENASTASSSRTMSGGSRYANLDKAQCESELARRHVPFDRVGEARGVVAPVRLTGRLGGIDFHSMLPASQRKTSPYEIYDCRLVLALDDFAKILAKHDVVEVVHFSVYRPPPPRFTGTGRRHAGALAIDAAIFKTKDGRTIEVEKDFHGRIGSKTCGSSASLPAEATTLRRIVCDAADAQLFNVLLTPDYNWQHRNHFHLEVTAGVRWQFLR